MALFGPQMDPSRVNWTLVFRGKNRPVGKSNKPDWPVFAPSMTLLRPSQSGYLLEVLPSQSRF